MALSSPAMTPQQADLVRPCSQLELERLLQSGAHILARGQTLHIAELGEEPPIQVAWLLLSFGPSHQRILLLTGATGALADDLPIPERRRVVHHLP